MPKSTAVTVVKMRNFRTGICEIWLHRLTTSAVEHPMISRPPIISPQRILLSSINELSISENDRFGFGSGFVSKETVGPLSTWTADGGVIGDWANSLSAG